MFVCRESGSSLAECCCISFSVNIVLKVTTTPLQSMCQQPYGWKPIVASTTYQTSIQIILNSNKFLSNLSKYKFTYLPAKHVSNLVSKQESPTNTFIHKIQIFSYITSMLALRRIGSGGGYLWMRLWIFGFDQIRRISWLTENRLTYQEGLSTVKYVIMFALRNSCKLFCPC